VSRSPGHSNDLFGQYTRNAHLHLITTNKNGQVETLLFVHTLILVKMLKAEFQMAEEKKAEKNPAE
jgi:hypothetical protein